MAPITKAAGIFFRVNKNTLNAPVPKHFGIMHCFIIATQLNEDRPVGDLRGQVERVLRLVDLNEYKRRQAPIGVRITRRGFGRDRRYPITSGWKLGD